MIDGDLIQYSTSKLRLSILTKLITVRRVRRYLFDDEGGTIAVALMADFNVNGDSWRPGVIINFPRSAPAA
jgi:hypothetical protein